MPKNSLFCNVFLQTSPEKIESLKTIPTSRVSDLLSVSPKCTKNVCLW